MRNLFITTAEAASLIAGGAALFVAGSAKALASLPIGSWIGGSTPYFMTQSGGLIDHDRVFVTVLDEAADVRTALIQPNALGQITKGRFANGFTYALIPAFSEALQRYALEAQDMPDLYDQPVVGWIAGIDLAEIGQAKPVVVDGATGTLHENAVAVMHVALASGKYAEPDIVNLFALDPQVKIVFPNTGFSATTASINGVERNLAVWLREINANTALPLVSSYAGAVINVSLQAVHDSHVDFYAPVIAGRSYHLAQPIADYPAAYGKLIAAQGTVPTLSFNCILNYLNASLEGRTTTGFVGPVTFGEIAYILLNQTLVRLDIGSD